MGAVTERHALEVEGTVIDLQLAGIVRTVQQHADSALIDTGGILFGELTVRIHRREGEVAAAQHSRAVPGQHRAGASLGDALQHRSGNIVGVRAVDELEIIDVKIAGALGAILRRSYANRIGAANIHRHLERGDICFYPGPALSCPVIECTAADCAVGIVAIILNISRRTGELFAVNIAYTAVIVKLHICGIEFRLKRSAFQHSLQYGVIPCAPCGHHDPHTDLGRLHRIDKKIAGETKVCCRNNRRVNLGEIVAKLESVLTETDVFIFFGTDKFIIPRRENHALTGRITNPESVAFYLIWEKLTADWFPVGINRSGRTDMG